MYWAPAQKTRMVLLLLACATTTLSGCALLFGQGSTEELSTAAAQPVVQRNIIRLDIAVAERPEEDSLLELLWDDVDEIGVLEADSKRLLNANGFRVGVAGSSLPSSLQTILREAAEQLSSQRPLNHAPGQLPGALQVTLFDKQETVFEVTRNGQLSYIEVDENGDPISDPTSFKSSRCVIRLTADRMQDGWIKLRFLPEIHHGLNSNRPMVGDQGLQFMQSQRVQPLYMYQFEVTLNPGEVAIVGPNESDEHTPGCRFFKVEGANGLLEKLITVRFLETSTVTGERAGLE